jgi:type I restriction enzyme, S subunit
MNNLKPYTKYKPSGIAWLGDIPEHWEVRKLKYIFTISKRISGELGHKVLSITQNGIKIKDIESGSGQLSMDYSKYQFVKRGDFAMNHMDLLTGYVDISNFNGVTSPDYRVFVAKNDSFNKSYLLLLLQLGYKQKLFYSLGQGVSLFGRWRLPAASFYHFNFPIPPLPEQTAISNFLDYKTAKIDRFIFKKKQLIKLLNEQKAGIINDAVTKGLNPNTKTKPSGIEWLGDIPEHWEVRKLKYEVTLNDETLPEKTNQNHEIRYIDIGNVDENGNVAEIVNYKFKDAPSRAKRVVKEGDVIISTVRTYLKAISQITWDCENLIVSTGFAVLRPKPKLESDFLNFSVRANYFLQKVCAESFGVSYPAINASELVNFEIAYPNLSEQKTIVSYIEKETAIINKTIGNIEKEIALVQEYRTAIIAEAVTGKIDVREYEFSNIITEEDNYEFEEVLSMAAEDEAEYKTEEAE